MCRLSLVSEEWGLLPSCGTQASQCGGFSCCGPWALGFVGSSCGFQALEHRLNTCDVLT